MNKRETRSLQARELRVAKNADGSRTLTGAIVYNSLSCDLGGWKEIIAPGAFAASMDDVLCLRDHKPTLLMGRTKSGTLALKDTSEELQFSCKLPDTEPARSLAEAVDRGDLDGVSFGFSVVNYETDVEWKVVGDLVVRTVLRAILWEISPCSWAAYPENSVSVRSLAGCPAELKAKIIAQAPAAGSEALPATRSSACDCTCDECVAGDCGDCSNSDCTDPECRCERSHKPPVTPPVALPAISDSDRQRMHMQLELRARE
jgi:hypothetical protein